MKALITGAGGFLGAHLVGRLTAQGWDVVGTVRPGSSRARLRDLGVAGGVNLIEADLSDRGSTRRAARLGDPDVAFLLAAARAAGSSKERAATAAVNASSPAWLVDALPDRCQVVVRVGSSTEYGRSDRAMDETAALRPRGYFGATKAAGSRLVAAAAAVRGLRSVVIRPFQVYGPLDHGTRLVPTAVRAARTGEPLLLTERGRRRDWVFVDDVVEAIVRAGVADGLAPAQVLNVGTGRQVANEDVVATLERVSGRPLDVRVGAHPGREWDAPSWVCDPSRGRKLLQWEATVDLTEGLRRCWAWDGASP